MKSFGQSAADGALPLLVCCVDERVASGEMWEPSASMHAKGTLNLTTTKDSCRAGREIMIYCVLSSATVQPTNLHFPFSFAHLPVPYPFRPSCKNESSEERE